MLTKERRQLWIILTIVFLGFLGISMPYLIFPALFLGATLAVYPIGQFIGSPILGSLSDDFGRKKLLWGSLLISAIANLCTGIAIAKGALGMLIISRFVAGFMEGNIAIARAMASELTSISKQEAFGKINASSSIAYLIGPLIGGLMTDKSIWEYLTTSTPFYFICIFFICLAALAAFMLKETPKNHIKEILSIYQRINIFKRMNILFRNKKLQFLMITSTAFTLGVDIFYEFGPVYLTVKWLLGPSDLALYNSVLCLALAIGNGMLPAFFSKHFPKKTIICSTLSSLTLILTIVALTNSPLLMVTLFGLSGLAIGLTATLITVKISNSVSDTIQGEVMGVQLSLRVLGDGLICLFGSALLLVSPKIILFLAAGILALTLIHYYKGSKRL